MNTEERLNLNFDITGIDTLYDIEVGNQFKPRLVMNGFEVLEKAYDMRKWAKRLNECSDRLFNILEGEPYYENSDSSDRH